MTIPPFEMMAAALMDQGNIWAGYRKDRARLVPGGALGEARPATIRPTRSTSPAARRATWRPTSASPACSLLDDAGVDFTYLGDKELCCATPMLVAGKWDVFERVMRAISPT